jgi:hypothetical protein
MFTRSFPDWNYRFTEGQLRQAQARARQGCRLARVRLLAMVGEVATKKTLQTLQSNKYAYVNTRQVKTRVWKKIKSALRTAGTGGIYHVTPREGQTLTEAYSCYLTEVVRTVALDLLTAAWRHRPRGARLEVNEVADSVGFDPGDLDANAAPPRRQYLTPDERRRLVHDLFLGRVTPEDFVLAFYAFLPDWAPGEFENAVRRVRRALASPKEWCRSIYARAAARAVPPEVPSPSISFTRQE